MNAPVLLVTATLMVAILLAASFLIATGTRGETAPRLTVEAPAFHVRHAPPAAR